MNWSETQSESYDCDMGREGTRKKLIKILCYNGKRWCILTILIPFKAPTCNVKRGFLILFKVSVCCLAGAVQRGQHGPMTSVQPQACNGGLGPPAGSSIEIKRIYIN